MCIYSRNLRYYVLTSIVSIYDVSSYPTYEKSVLTRKFTTYDRNYEIVTFHQSYEKCLHRMFSRYPIVLVSTRYDVFTRSYAFTTFRDIHP